MKNAEWLVKKGINFRALDVNYADPVYEHHDTRILISVPNEPKPIMYRCRVDYGDIYEGLFEWFDAEHKEPILDKTEKEYLENLLRPWKKTGKVWVRKKNFRNDKNWELLFFTTDKYSFVLPPFRAETMYKRMHTGEDYTPKELGLWEDER